jgi:hypothetical protein
VISKAAFVVGEIFSPRHYVRQLLSSIAGLTKDLLLVSSCRQHSGGSAMTRLMEQVRVF